MQSVERESWQRRRVAREGPAWRPSLFALATAFALAACAGSSPEITAEAADASEPATAPGGSAAAAPAAAPADATPTENPDASSSDITPSEPTAEPAPSSEPVAAENETASDGATGEGAETDVQAAVPEPPPPVEQQAAVAATDAADYLPASPPGSGLAAGRPYVIIRFARTNIDYEAALTVAVEKAVARRPNVAFDLVAVAPAAASAAEEASRAAVAEAQTAQVLEVLARLGFGPDRVSVQPWTGEPAGIHEIRLYIR